MKNILLPLALVIVSATSCDTTKKISPEVIATDTANTNRNQTISLDYINTDVRPQDDFFEFCNGTWITNNPIPASESRWGSFNELENSNNKKLTAILEEARSLNTEKGTIMQILGDYYASFMDMETRNKKGLQAIELELKEIDNMISKWNIPTLLAHHHASGIGSLFGFGVGQDLKNVDYHTVYFGQGGIGLPNKDYYIDSDKKDILEKYTEHIYNIFMLAGTDKQASAKAAKDILNFETKLAERMMAPAELRIPEKTYNKMSAAHVKRAFGKFDFEAYLRDSGIESFDSIVVGQPEMIKQIANMTESIELPVWKNYLKWNVLNRYAGHLNQAFIDKNFGFYGTVLTGKSEMKPINERAIQEITNSEFSELLGKAFVGRHFSDAANQKVNTMVDNLLVVFEERINKLDWMSETTKNQALLKLNSIGRKLGYPSKWEDFSNLDFNKTDYIANLRKTAQFSHAKNLAKLNEKVDKDEWGMPAHMVNAYYHPLLNEIAFPAGIMQAPFFDEDYEDAVNYGSIGMVIGHEFTHGFDDMGSKFAADGSFVNWWTENDRTAFEERTGKLGATFDGFCPIDGHCVNSSLTMGENIADLGGLTLAYHAYTRTDEYKSGITRKGFTPSQRFFISYAQLWKINYTEEELKNRIENDPHSPGMYRVNGPLMNCPEFFDAFNVLESDKMRNSDSKIARIW